MPVRRVIYVLGAGHSGSTLLDLMLGAHPEVTSVGELNSLPKDLRTGTPCTCGEKIAACPLWTRVLERTDPSVLGDAKKDGKRTTIHDNAALFDAIAQVAGTPIVVDSSKMPVRLRRIIADVTVPITVIHLVRDPRAVARSQLRKQRRFRRAVTRWCEVDRECRALVASLPAANVVRLRYEDLARDPADTMARLLPRLKLEFDDRCVSGFRDREVHNIHGNRMRRQAAIEVTYHHEFLDALGPVQWHASTLYARRALARYGYPRRRSAYLERL